MLLLVQLTLLRVMYYRVVSGSRDATLRVWNVDTGTCLHVLMGHVAAVRCVQYDGRRVVSGAYDYMVKVWDPESETCLHTLQGHTNRVYSLQVYISTHISRIVVVLCPIPFKDTNLNVKIRSKSFVLSSILTLTNFTIKIPFNPYPAGTKSD